MSPSRPLQYLFLLFDENNFLNSVDSNFVFTTEGHILYLNSTHLRPMSAVRRKLRRLESPKCPAYVPLLHGGSGSVGLVGTVRSRPDIDYAKYTAGVRLDAGLADDDLPFWDSEAWCELPQYEAYVSATLEIRSKSLTGLQTYDFILSRNGEQVAEDPTPSTWKVQEVDDGFMIFDVTGIRAEITSRMDGKGFEFTRRESKIYPSTGDLSADPPTVGPHKVRTGQTVYVNDPQLNLVGRDAKAKPERELEVPLTFTIPNLELVAQLEPRLTSLAEGTTFSGWTAEFGGDPTHSHPKALRFGRGSPPLALAWSVENVLGCHPYSDDEIPPHSVLIVHRGDCTFAHKLKMALGVGAAGVIVISSEDATLNPVSDPGELDNIDGVAESALVVVSKTVGQILERLMFLVERHVDLEMLVHIEPDTTTPARDNSGKPNILYINGHPVLNAILL